MSTYHSGSQFCFSLAKYLPMFFKLMLRQKAEDEAYLEGTWGEIFPNCDEKSSNERPTSAGSCTYLGRALFLW